MSWVDAVVWTYCDDGVKSPIEHRDVLVLFGQHGEQGDMLIQSFASLVKLLLESRCGTSASFLSLAPIEVCRVDGGKNRFRGVFRLCKVGLLIFVEMFQELFARFLEIFQLPLQESRSMLLSTAVQVSVKWALRPILRNRKAY